MVCKWTGLWSSKAEVMALTWITDNFYWTSGKNPCPIETSFNLKMAVSQTNELFYKHFHFP